MFPYTPYQARWSEGKERSLVAWSAVDTGTPSDKKLTVQRAEASHVTHRVSPGFPVPESRIYVLGAEPFGLSTCLAILAQSAKGTESLIGGKELGSVGEVHHHPPAEDADEDGNKTFDDDCGVSANSGREAPGELTDPSPSLITSNTVHLGDSGSQQTTKRASKRGSGEEKSGTETEFGALVPTSTQVSNVPRYPSAVRNLRKVVVDTREQSSLRKTEEETARQQSSLILDNAHDSHDGSPEEDDGREENTRRVALEQKIGKGLSSGIGDEEDCQSIVVVAAAHVDAVFHFRYTGISNVGPVQEGEEIQ